MEQNPIYQGTQYVAANTATSNANVPRKLLFADEWERNRHATTQALQGIEQALIERNDNTVLLNQQAEAKRRDLDMTKEMQSILDLSNGVDGSWYDTNGKLNKQAVRDFIKKYSTMPIQWGKAIVSPEGQQKSASMSQAYQIGVQEAVEAAILANTKKRELQAYKENMRLATEMKDWESRAQITADAVNKGVISYQEAATESLQTDQGMLQERIDACETKQQLMDLYYDPDFQDQLSLEWNSEIKDALEKRINHLNDTQATTADDYYEVDPKTGKLKAVAGKATPPDGAPYYIKNLFSKHNGRIPEEEAMKAIQQYLGEEVDELDSTAKGAQQRSRAHEMATKTLGLKDEAFNRAYKIRTQQLKVGNINAKAILDNIDDSYWLTTTQDDEKLLKALTDGTENISELEKKNRLTAIAKARRDIINSEYTNWLTQATSGDEKPTPQQQYAALLEIVRRRGKEWEGIIPAINSQTTEFRKSVADVEREVIKTGDRKRTTQAATALTDTLTSFVNSVKSRMGISDALSEWKVSSDINFAYDLAYVNNSLPESKKKNIIYLPKNSPLPAKSANVTTKNGTLGLTIEFRNADVEKPTPSVKLICSLRRPVSSPASIAWDGRKLIVSEEIAERPNTLIADNGLANDIILTDEDL